MTSQDRNLTSLSTTPESANKDESNSNHGTVAGIIVVCVFLVVSTILGLIFYLRRRNREVGPNKDFDKITQNRVSETSTSWTEIDKTSERASGISTHAIHDECHDVEMQPSNLFPLTPVEFSLYDNPELEDQTIYDKELNEFETTTTKNSSKISDSLTKKDDFLESGKRRQSDKSENSKIHANTHDVKEQMNTGYLNDEDSDDYEFVEVDQITETVQMSNSRTTEEDQMNTDDDGVYVNFTLGRRGSRDDQKEEIVNDSGKYKQHISTKQDKKPSKAPIPQPRLSLKDSQSNLSITDSNNHEKVEINVKKQTDPPELKITPKDTENDDSDTNEDDLGDYDSVDLIYDVPRNNKSIHEESEKL